MNPNQVMNKNKNPLLSCAVTGGFEEFSGSGIVLTAAEKPVFTIGAPAISDTDNFSDVSLDRDATFDTTTQVDQSSFYSPLAELDSMGNLQNIQSAPTLELSHDQQEPDANLNPISAALAQLPNAASTVFSTFTNIIKGSASHPRMDEPINAPLMAEPPQEPSNPYGFMYASNSDAPAPPPSFFSPTDDSLFKRPTAEPTTNNTFRLGGNKKKTYAHIPGLTNNAQLPAAQAFTASPIMPPLPPVVAADMTNHFAVPSTNDYGSQAAQREPEKSNKFSLSSLLPSQLLEKIPVFGPSETSFEQQQQSYEQNQPNFFNSQADHLSTFVVQNSTVPATSQAPVNFFNAQQFNTSPFAQVKAADQFAVADNVPPAGVEETQSIPQPPMTIPSQTFNPSPFPSASNQQAVHEPAVLPPTANCPPPTFFNPVEASEMFRTNLSDDGKPRNPYSGNRMSRGVGMYKTRAAVEVGNVQHTAMTPMPVASQIPSQFPAAFPPLPVVTQNPAAVDPQQIPSRPPSIPPLPAVSYGSNHHEQNAASEVFPPPDETIRQPVEPASLFFDTSRVTATSVFEPSRKSDLNVPDQTSALNFFHAPPAVPQFENVPQINAGDASAMNFFQPQPTAPEMSNFNQTAFNLSSTNFFSSDSTAASQPSEARDEMTSFYAPNVNSTVDTSINDISDKLDSLSMSENIGSTLSLFATSELDSTTVQKSPFESLVPKYLDTQSAVRATSSPIPQKNYRPVYRHWFYQNLYWHPLAMSDSLALDDALINRKEVVVTDGGRFEVNLEARRRSSVYWSSGTSAVRRCSWFFKNPNGTETNLIPFDEDIAEFMESEYEKAVVNNSWNHRVELPNSGEFLVMKDPSTLEYHQMGQTLVVKRGVDEFVIDDGEEASVDHLIVFISSFGDKIDDSANELRSKCMETIQHYYSEAYDCGQVGRVEILPISLNSVDVLKMKETSRMIEAAPGGSSDMMKSSICQDIVMKTAFYCNQEFYQNIMNHLAFSLNEIVLKFRQRNPEFKGEVSLVATSFEALFLFDLLLKQDSAVDFWKLHFEAANFYAFGMPSNLLTIRNEKCLKSSLELRNCKKFLNVVHRLDPIAQRIEPLVKPELSKLPPESIENATADRLDYTIADGSSLESFSLKNYFTSELVILRITNEIYGALKMDSGSL